MTSQTSNVCNILAPFYHGYFQLIALAVFKVVKLMFDLRLLSWFILLDTQTWQEVSYERGSVLLLSISTLWSVRKFSQNWLTCFSETYYGVRNPYLVICDGGRFIFEKKIMSKIVKKDQKTKFFGIFKRIKSLVLTGIGVKRKLLWSFNTLWKLHACKKFGSEVMTNIGSRSMRFQYFLIVNISLIDWHLTLIFGM